MCFTHNSSDSWDKRKYCKDFAAGMYVGRRQSGRRGDHNYKKKNKNPQLINKLGRKLKLWVQVLKIRLSYRLMAVCYGTVWVFLVYMSRFHQNVLCNRTVNVFLVFMSRCWQNVNQYYRFDGMRYSRPIFNSSLDLQGFKTLLEVVRADPTLDLAGLQNTVRTGHPWICRASELVRADPILDLAYCIYSLAPS